MYNPIAYVLSDEADNDLNDIFDYTEQEHGFDQAILYLTAFETLFKRLVNNPEIGRQRDEIKPGLYSLTEQQHVVFYRILKNRFALSESFMDERIFLKRFKEMSLMFIPI